MLGACPVCRKQVHREQKRRKTKAGAWAHDKCMPKAAVPAARRRVEGIPGKAAAAGRSGVSAAYAGTCPLCRRGYQAGTKVAKSAEGWAHAACAQAQRERDRILSGETFRGHKPSDWKLGSSPSSSRPRR